MASTLQTLREHGRIIQALLFREIATRYGRNNIGFLWVLGEPMVFCIGVLIMYRLLRGPYDRGVEVIPFIFTGYMPLILVRHMVMFSMNAVKINSSLLYHKSITVLDLYLTRMIMEFIGVSLGGCMVFPVLMVFGLAEAPRDIGMVYVGWFATGLVGMGMGLLLGAISEIFEIVERIVGVALYILVPVSGTFFLADWLPEGLRKFALMLPFLNCAEMIRLGFFGPSIHPHFDIAYTYAFGGVMTFLGLLLVRQVRERVEVF